MKTLKFSLKSFWLSIFSVNTTMGFLLVSIGLFTTTQVSLAAGAREYENPPCYDVTGSSTALKIDGIPNSGIVDFDDSGVAPAYQACVRMSSSAADAVPARVEGWVWDNNLGWVSLYCPGGVGAKNLDINCGSVAYGVTFTTTGTAPDFSSVKLAGNAWGDNIGYISFSSSFHQVSPIPSGVNKGLIETSVGSAGYHAWSNAVGWLDLRGVVLNWYDTDPPLPDPNVNKYISICSDKDLLPPDPQLGSPKCSCDLAKGCTLSDVAKTPDANGVDKYAMEVTFVDGVTPIDNSKIQECPTGSINMYAMGSGGYAYCAKMALTWEDDVDYDQTTGLSQSQGATAKFNNSNSGAVTKPLISNISGASDFTYNPAKVLWAGFVRSNAPTSDRNVYESMENEKFYYQDAAGLPGGYDPTKGGQNKLLLKELKLIFFKYSTDGTVPGTCVYGTAGAGGTCMMKTYVANADFSFNPLSQLSQLVYKGADNKWLNYINVSSVDNQQSFHDQLDVKSGIENGTLTVSKKIGMQNGGAYSMNWVDAFPQPNPADPSNTQIHDTLSISNAVAGISDLIGQIFYSNPGESISSTAGPYVYSKIAYKVSGVANPTVFFSAKLPRIKAGLLLNPVAKVQGNVYVTDFAQKSSDFSIRSLGNISSNLRREAVVRNVAKYLGGFTASIVTGDRTVNVNNFDAQLTRLVQDKVYYLKNGNLTIDCGATCTFDKNITFIVENGNILVNSDIRSNDGKTQVGLIALRDLTKNVQNQGFLYLSKQVGWLQNVQIYLDKIMMSYVPGTTSFDSNGFALLIADDYERQSIFNNQLVLEGTISSMNGIGNASRLIPVYESGAPITPLETYCASYRQSQAGGSNLDGICRARVADLNYLRYYGPGLEICTGSEGPNAVANMPKDQALKADADGGCNPVVAGYDINAGGLYASSSSSADNGPGFDLVSGGGLGQRSTYFVSKGLPATLHNEYPVNFFYIPIAKDLAGFQIDQAFNPLIQN